MRYLLIIVMITYYTDLNKKIKPSGAENEPTAVDKDTPSRIEKIKRGLTHIGNLQIKTRNNLEYSVKSIDIAHRLHEGN